MTSDSPMPGEAPTRWTGLAALDALVAKASMRGARVSLLGSSAEGRPLWGVEVGDPSPRVEVAVVAGFHADELAGPAYALRLIQRMTERPVPGVRFHVVPAADPDLLQRNVSGLAVGDLPELLQATHSRDLEGQLAGSDGPECRAVRDWLANRPRIDAYFSLHAAQRITPGAFFYVTGRDPEGLSGFVDEVARCMPKGIPLLDRDPTGRSPTRFARGFFAIPTSQRLTSLDQRERTGTSIEFVTERFHPAFLGVSEVPLATCSGLESSSLPELEEFNRRYARGGGEGEVHVVDLEAQMEVYDALVMAPTRRLLRGGEAPRA